MKQTNTLEKQRFAFVLNFLKETKFIESQVAFSARMGIRKTFFYDINRKKSPMYMNIYPVLNKVKYEFPFINDEWVRTGVGCIFISELLPKADIDYQYYIDEAAALFKEPNQINLLDIVNEIDKMKKTIKKLTERIDYLEKK